MKRWLTERGIPHIPKKRPAKPAKAPLRALEPYAVGTTQAAQQIATTALDNLFSRFIHKQEEDTAGQAPTTGQNKAGIQRLFGNLDVLKSEAETGGDRARQVKDEDDALVKLLGGLVTTPTPAPSIPRPTPTEKQSKLLSLLKMPSPTPAISTPQPKQAAIKPHQASLLAVLSPAQQPRTPAGPSTQATLHSEALYFAPPSSPGLVDSEDEERRRRQRALLDGITAGVGYDLPAAGPSNVGGMVNNQNPSPLLHYPQERTNTSSPLVDSPSQPHSPYTKRFNDAFSPPTAHNPRVTNQSFQAHTPVYKLNAPILDSAARPRISPDMNGNRQELLRDQSNQQFPSRPDAQRGGSNYLPPQSQPQPPPPYLAQYGQQPGSYPYRPPPVHPGSTHHTHPLPNTNVMSVQHFPQPNPHAGMHGGGGRGGGGYHPPIPRAPNGNSGVLLGMLNGGRNGR
jgi:hypothetical protein